MPSTAPRSTKVAVLSARISSINILLLSAVLIPVFRIDQANTTAIAMRVREMIIICSVFKLQLPHSGPGQH